MKISLIQMNSISDKAANIAQASKLIEDAVRDEKPDWVLLPETFDWAGGSAADKQAVAEEIPGGPAYLAMQALAKRHGIFIHAGSILEKRAGEARLSNTTVVFNRSGEEIAQYRKIHLFDVTAPDGQSYKESNAIAPGNAVVTYDVEGVTVGCAICYDLRFADLFLALAEKGARAIETGTYFAAAAQCGTFHVGNEARATYGHSLVVDPWGHVIAKASDGIGTVSARLDLTKISKVRAMIPVSHHRVKLRA